MDASVTKEEQKQLDAEHDILFYLGTDGASYTFTPESGCTVTVARSTVGKTMTFNGFTSQGVTVDAETGAVTVANLTKSARMAPTPIRSSPPVASATSCWTPRAMSCRRMPRSSPARRCSCSSLGW